MTIYERAKQCIPENTWNDIVEQWKIKHPNLHEYVRLSGGAAYSRQSFASKLNYLGIPFCNPGSISFLAAFGFGVFSEIEDESDLSTDNQSREVVITFLTVPKDFAIRDLTGLERIEYYDKMIYYKGVPIPILSKMHEMGKLFTK